MACEDFKKTKSPLKMATKAKKIYEDFIQTGGPKEVGLLFLAFFYYSYNGMSQSVIMFQFQYN